jgi:hypothetical protein
LVAAADSPVADAPVPAGFWMTSESRSSVTPGTQLRFVDHYYKGSEALLPVVAFYREQMPKNGWTLLNQQQQMGGDWLLTFTKGSEDLMISLSEGTFHLTIHMRLEPAARGAAAAK